VVTKEPGAFDSFVAEISQAVGAFSEEDADSKQALDRLSSSHPPKFLAAGIQVAATAEPSAGSRYLVLLLAKDKRLSNWLLDPKVCTLDEAAAVARAAADAGMQARIQASFEMALNTSLEGQASATNADRILRILNVLAVTGNQICWDPFQIELMAYPDKVVRSKAALLIGQSSRNVARIAHRLLDRDPRVQSNAVEALWCLDAAVAKPHLLEALKSKHNRVFANAALGLYRLGDPDIIAVLLEATQHTNPVFRVSALWAIGQTQDACFLPVLMEQFKAAEGKPRLALAGAIARIRQRDKRGSDPK
jgi:hypothetical protein